jgi:tetratricopeptide (TPR) repeat protein
MSASRVSNSTPDQGEKFRMSRSETARSIAPVVVRSAPAIQRLLALVCLAAITACSSVPKPSQATAQPAEAAPAVVALEEWVARGDAAILANDHGKAREAWRAAAKDYPTAKLPWLRLSEDYFNTGDYGNAVLAAQETLQRDPRDRLANSVLAVSGLRLTAGSLAALRADGAYAVGSRDEAVAVTRALRDALGEPVLVPPPESAPQRKRYVKPTRSAPAGTEAAAAAGNPLDKLK